jgi:hypothetical protein
MILGGPLRISGGDAEDLVHAKIEDIILKAGLLQQREPLTFNHAQRPTTCLKAGQAVPRRKAQ